MADEKGRLTRSEYLEKLGTPGFSVHPLDIHLAKMQDGIIQQMNSKGDIRQTPITEHWVSRNPEMRISKVSICCQLWPKSLSRKCYEVVVRVTDKHLRYIAEMSVWRGYMPEFHDFVTSDEFFIRCKQELLWLDYALKKYTEDDGLLKTRWKRSQDMLHDMTEYVAEQCSRLLLQWREAIPESGAFVPLLDIIINPDSATRDIAASYGLKVYKMPDDIVADPRKRYVEAMALIPGGDYKIDMVVASGTNDEIQEQLKSDEFVGKIAAAYADFLDNLRFSC